MAKQILIPTDVAVAFILRMRGQTATPDTMKSAREHIYNRAKNGSLHNHGGSKRSEALWDLIELAKPYPRAMIVRPA